MSFYKSISLGVSAIALSVGLPALAQADPVLPNLTNLNFLNYTGAAPKNPFTSVDPVGWTGGNGLIYIDSPTPGKDAASGSGGIPTYGDPSVLGGPAYNYVEADGNPYYESGFNYSVTGLTVGTTYQLSFYQAASQEVGFSGATTNQWIVSLGTSGLYVESTTAPGVPDNACGSNCQYVSTDATASIAATTLMNVPNEGLVNWNYVTVDLTADATTDLLSFLAWGDNGNTANLPPMAFLTGVNAPPGLVPEPGTLSLFGVGLLGLGAVMRRRRAKVTQAA